MLYRQLLDQQATPPTILNSGVKSALIKFFVQLATFLDQTNTITSHNKMLITKTVINRKEPTLFYVMASGGLYSLIYITIHSP